MAGKPSSSSGYADTKFIFIDSQKDNTALLFSGYRYNLIVSNKGGSSRWRCANRDICSATITINKDKTSVLRSSEHACRANHIKNRVDVVMDRCKKAVCKKYKPVQQIFEKEFAAEECEDYVPNFESKKDTLRRARRNFLRTQRTEAVSLKDVKVPEILANDFLLCDDGTDDKILIFCSKFMRSALKKLEDKVYFIDGTFTRTPKPFCQIVSLHVDLHSTSNSVNVVAVIYALLPDKQQCTYERFFELLKVHLGIIINKIKCDYEMAIINALKKAFPQINISGCYFHLNKAVWKKAEALKADQNKESKEIIAICANFPLLPTVYYTECWLDVKQHAAESDCLDKFLNYFEKQWLKPTVDMSCYNDIFRTNNPIEGWNRRFNSKVNRKPTFILFLDTLRKEAKWQEIKFKNNIFHGSKRKKIDISFNVKYTEELKKLEEKRITPFEFLRRVTLIKRILNIDNNHDF